MTQIRPRHEIERFRRSYKSETDLPVVLALKQICTTAQNIYDAPTTSDLCRLLAPFSESTTNSKQSWEEAHRGISPEHAQRTMTQRLTALWEDASGTLYNATWRGVSGITKIWTNTPVTMLVHRFVT